MQLYLIGKCTDGVIDDVNDVVDSDDMKKDIAVVFLRRLLVY